MFSWIVFSLLTDVFSLTLWWLKAEMYVAKGSMRLGSGRTGGGKRALAPWMMVLFGHYYEWFLTFSVGAGAWGESDGVGVGPLTHPGGWGLDLCLIFCNAFCGITQWVVHRYQSSQATRGIYFQSYICANFWLFTQVSVKWNKYKDIHLGFPNPVISTNIMWSSQVGDSSHVWKSWKFLWAKGNFCNKGTLYTLIGSGLYRCTTVSKPTQCTIKTQNSFSSKEILETNIKLWLIGMLKNLEGILSEIHKKVRWTGGRNGAV